MNNYNQNFLEAIKIIAQEKSIPRDAIVDVLKEAITKSYMKDFPEEIINVDIDLNKQILDVYKTYLIVPNSDDVNDYCEKTIEEAKMLENVINPKIGDTVKQPLSLVDFEKSTIIQIMQIFKQGINQKTNAEIFNRWENRVGEVIYAEVDKNLGRTSYVDLGNGEFGFLSYGDSIPDEKLIPGQKYNFYIKEIKQQTAGWPIILSRADVNLIKHLLKLEIPEIQENIIEVVDIARVPGFKTKVSLISHQPGVDPCGTTIGPHGSRIQNVSAAVRHENIEVIEYSDNFEKYLADVCSPAKISGYKIIKEATEEHKRQLIIVIDTEQMALIIGKKGANIRLISQLLRSDIDVKPTHEAVAEGFDFKFVEVKTIRQRGFDKAYERNFKPINFEYFNSASVSRKKGVVTTEPKTEDTYSEVSSTVQQSVSIIDAVDKFNFSSDGTTQSIKSHKKSQLDILSKLKPAKVKNISSIEQELEESSKKRITKKVVKKYSSKPKASTLPKLKSSIFDELSQDKEALLKQLSEDIDDFNNTNESEKDYNEYGEK